MSNPRKALVVGSGSIARRHLSNLRALLPDAEVGCVSASGRPLADGETVATTQLQSIAAAVAWAPDLAVVASPAPLHLDHACRLLDASIPVLIEKPLSDRLDRVRAAAPHTPRSSAMRMQADLPWNGPSTSSVPSKR